MKIKFCFLLMTFAGINISAANAQEELILFTFGDSITAGMISSGNPSDCHSGVSLGPALSGSGRSQCFGNGAEGVGGYQPELKQSLEELGYDVSIYNYGYSGITTDEMMSRISSDLNQQPNSDYVLLMGGANDVFAGVLVSDLIFNLQSMVNTICSRGMIPVLATVTRNYIGSYNSIASNYNNAIREIDTESSNCEVLPAEQYYALYGRENYGSDGLHLSSLGNSNMAIEWFTALALIVDFNGGFLPAVMMLLTDD